MPTRPITVDVPRPLPAATPRLLRPGNAAWRAPLAAASLVTAAAHVPVTGEHLEEAPYIGVLFIALELAAVVLAAVILRRPTRAALLAVSVVGALALLAMLVSRTVGLPLIGDDVGDWTEPLAVVSVAAELVMAVGGAVAGLGSARSTPRALLVGAAAGALILGLGALSTGIAAAAEAGAPEHGQHDMEHMSDGDMDHMEMG